MVEFMIELGKAVGIGLFIIWAVVSVVGLLVAGYIDCFKNQ